MMNIKNRIDDLLVVMADPRIMLYAQREAVKQLLRDVLDEVTPKPYTEDQGLDAEMESYNGAVDYIQDKRKELGL